MHYMPFIAKFYWSSLDGIREDMCGFEEITHAPEAAEFRPTPAMNPNMTTPYPGGWGPGMSAQDQAILGGKTWTCCFALILSPNLFLANAAH